MDWPTWCVRPGAGGYERQKRTGIWRTARYNLMYQHPSDWHNNTGAIRQAEVQGMGVILMRPLTSGVFQRLMARCMRRPSRRPSAST